MEEINNESGNVAPEVSENIVPEANQKKVRKPFPKAGWIILFCIGIALVAISFLFPGKTAMPLNNNSVCGVGIGSPPCNISIVPAKLDVSQELCNALVNASEQANITTTKYYFQNPYCVWQVVNYTQEYAVHCENINQTLNVMIRPYNMTKELIQSRFPECNVTQR
jgi:hypothetical protein